MKDKVGGKDVGRWRESGRKDEAGGILGAGWLTLGLGSDKVDADGFDSKGLAY